MKLWRKIKHKVWGCGPFHPMFDYGPNTVVWACDVCGAAQVRTLANGRHSG